MGTHESTVVVRMPDELKSRLKMEAKKLGMSVSELIRMKLLAIDPDGGEKRAVVRLGDRKYELDDILRPDLISYEPVSGERSKRKGITLTLGFEKKKKKGGKEVFSDECQDLIARMREIAIDFVNDAIAPEHILYAMTEMEGSNAHRILGAFEVDTEAIGREIDDLMRREGKMVSIGNVPLTRGAEKVVRGGTAEAKSLDEDIVGTEHLLLAILRDADSVAATLLVGEGVRYDEVREVVRSGR